MIPIVMPQVGQDIPQGKIVQWLKKENEPVEKGEVILIVESEKASFEIEADESGVLLKILHSEGEEVDILKPVGYIGRPGESVEALLADVPETSAVHSGPETAERRGQVASHLKESRPDSERIAASPSARRLAQELGVDMSLLKGSGPGGRITRDDVSNAGKARPVESSGADTVVPFSKMRKRIAERLTASKRDIPHFYISVDVNMTDALRWRRDFNSKRGVKVTITDLIIKAAAAALEKFPRLNAHVDREKIVVRKSINIGVAVSVEDGLLVPVIHDANVKNLIEISELSKKNTESARRGVETGGPAGTFTITSMGMHGVRQFVPIINPPECAILAVGSIAPCAVAESGGIVARDMMTLTMACDHRAVDGVDAAGLLNEIKSGLEGIAGTGWE